jgi:hypothetical protein
MSITGPADPAGDGSRRSLISASGLLVDASTSAGDGVLDEFYRHYDAAFVLENEKESYEGFADCLALNAGDAFDRLVHRFGTFREFVLVVRDPQTGTPIGGANFIAFPLAQSKDSAPAVLSMNLNYAFINQAFRRRGLFKRLVLDLPDIALRLLVATNRNSLPIEWFSSEPPGTLPDLLMFIEQNDPYRMPRNDYVLDTQYTGLDQMARIGIWARLGTKIVDFAYAQPPLTSEQEADYNLVYGVLGARGKTLDPCLLRGHLERFFGISVLKGADPMTEPTAAEQLRTLDRMCEARATIGLLIPGSLSDAPSPLSKGQHAPPPSLRDYLRG